jgi:hypothetical protein
MKKQLTATVTIENNPRLIDVIQFTIYKLSGSFYFQKYIITPQDKLRLQFAIHLFILLRLKQKKDRCEK